MLKITVVKAAQVKPSTAPVVEDKRGIRAPPCWPEIVCPTITCCVWFLDCG